MSIYPPQNNIRDIIVILFILGFPLFLSAQEPDLDKSANRGYEEKLTELQEQARMYRRQGLEMQDTGNLDTAMSLYQKAIELDPAYAVVYNDLGIIYEAKGLIDLAEENYLKSIKIDPMYLSTYSNLALLYENKRDLEKAAFYWEKRAKLGPPGNIWTERAKKRLRDIQLVLSKNPLEVARQQEIIEQLKDAAIQRTKDNKELAEIYLEKAKQKFRSGDEVTALKIAIDASLLDPSNTEIEEFISKNQTRLLSR